MAPITAAILSYHILLSLTAWIPSGLIRGYLKHKPFGLQTVLDIVAMDLTFAVQFGLTSFSVNASLGILNSR